MSARRRILVDLDNTLCEGKHWVGEEVLQAVPKPEMISKINQLYLNEFIIIWTARPNHLIGWTLDWLTKNGVKFHAISNFKIPGDLMIDDLAIRPEEL